MGILIKARNLYSGLAQRANILQPFALLFVRITAAYVFFKSGLTKWNGFLSFNPDKYDLFMYEFFCPEEPRAGALVLCKDVAEGTYAPTTQWIVERFANLAGVMEIILPILLVLGLVSRLSAFGLLAMTMFIQIFVFPEWGVWWGSHIWWAATLLAIVAIGPGRFSLDHYLGLDKAQSLSKA